MMNFAGLDLPRRRQLWTKAAATATKLDNITVDDKNNESPYWKFYGKNPKYKKHL